MKELYKALAGFQQECPVIYKGTEGYGYSYADLPTIYEVIMPLLKKYGLGFTQLLKDDGLETQLFHIESGEVISSFCRIPMDVELAKMNPYQVIGSAYTYYRRYALSAILGIITDKDDDTGNIKTAGTKTASYTPRSGAQKPKPTPSTSKVDMGVPACSICSQPMKKSARTGKWYCKHDNAWGDPVWPEKPLTPKEQEFFKDMGPIDPGPYGGPDIGDDPYYN